jgi:hypothetical protein
MAGFMGLPVPQAISNDPQHWRKRAAEARAMADQIVDPVAKRAMLEIAKGYERIAERAERRKPTVQQQQQVQPKRKRAT